MAHGQKGEELLYTSSCGLQTGHRVNPSVTTALARVRVGPLWDSRSPERAVMASPGVGEPRGSECPLAPRHLTSRHARRLGHPCHPQAASLVFARPGRASRAPALLTDARPGRAARTRADLRRFAAARAAPQAWGSVASAPQPHGLLKPACQRTPHPPPCLQNKTGMFLGIHLIHFFVLPTSPATRNAYPFALGLDYIFIISGKVRF